MILFYTDIIIDFLTHLLIYNIMKKILIAILFSGAILGGVWFAFTQLGETTMMQPKTYKIGLLYRGENFKPVAQGFVEGMNAIVSNRNKVEYIEEDVLGPEQKDFDVAAEKLMEKKPDLIFVIALEPIIAAKKATAETATPVVLTLGGDPALLGLIDSFKNPGGNLTGISWDVWNLSGKRLEVLKLMDPRIKRVFIFGKKGSQPMRVSLEKIIPAAKALNIETVISEVENADELARKVLAIQTRPGDAIYYAPDPFIARNSKPIIDASIQKMLPTIFHEEYFVNNGALASYGANFVASGKQAAKIAANILFEGQQPKDMPIQSPDTIDFIINITTAEKIGLTVAPEAIAQAQKLIR